MRGIHNKQTIKSDVLRLLRHPAVLLVLAVELLIFGQALAAALRPAAVYEFTADQWESIAQESEIGRDEDGRVGVVEMTDGEDILQTPAMDLPAGHYKVTVDYNYIPGRLEDGRQRHASVYLKAEMPYVLTGEKELLPRDSREAAVELNVRHAFEAVHLIACNGGGIFTLGSVRVAQDMRYAAACAMGWLLGFAALDGVCLAVYAARDDGARKRKWRIFFVLAAVTLLACAPLLTDGGGLRGDDSTFHLSRIEGIAQGLREGQFPVRIYSQAKDGYGYAPSLFYGELLLYFPAALRLLGVSVQGAYHAYAVVIMALTAGLAFASLRQIFREDRIALLGAALYTLAPYHLHNVYVRMAVGEYTAQAFLPLIPAALCLLYGAEPPTKDQRRTAWVELTFAFTMLLQSHMLSLELAALVCAVVCLCGLRRTFTKPVFGVWAAAVVAVLLLNLWFLLPFAGEMLTGGYIIQQNSSLADAFDIQRGALHAADLLAVDGKSLGLGLEFFVGAAAFLWCAWLSDRRMDLREKRIGSWALAIGLAACFMSTPLFPWGDLKALPVAGNLLLKTQFAWRFLTVATPAMLLVGCCTLSCLRGRRAGALLAGVTICLSLVGTLQFYRSYLPTMQTEYLGSSGELIYAKEYSNETWAFDSLYLPTGVHQREDIDGIAEGAEPVTTVEVSSITQENGVTTLECAEMTGQLQHAELPLVYYPGYTVIEGEGTIFRTANDLVGVAVPANYSGTIRVAFREPKRWLAADLVSLAAALALLVLPRYKKRHKK